MDGARAAGDHRRGLTTQTARLTETVRSHGSEGRRNDDRSDGEARLRPGTGGYPLSSQSADLLAKAPRSGASTRLTFEPKCCEGSTFFALPSPPRD